MDVAVVGASGVIGRQIAISLVEGGVLPPTSRLQLVGRSDGASARLLPGLAVDLSDAFAETIPEIDVALESEELLADIVIVAAGAAVPTDPDSPRDRDALARDNRPIFERYARALARTGHGEELVLVVTNPVELGVQIFSEHHPRERVIGMGAFLDTLRFRREIAAELGVRRQVVHGLVLGEHGAHMVPCFSTVSAFGFDSDEGRRKIAALRRSDDPSPTEAVQRAARVLGAEGPMAAYRLAADWGPALRAYVKPYITHLSGAKTPVGTAEIISRLVETILGGRQMLAAAQLRLEGEFLGIHGVTGVPALLSNRGVERVEALALSDDEAAAVLAAAAHSATLIQESR
jgi:malate dehydrogenase